MAPFSKKREGVLQGTLMKISTLQPIEDRKSNATGPTHSKLCLWAFRGGRLLHYLCLSYKKTVVAVRDMYGSASEIRRIRNPSLRHGSRHRRLSDTS